MESEDKKKRKEALFKKAKKAVLDKSTSLFFVSDVYAVLGVSESMFYYYFPKGSEELETIKELLNKNRVNKCIGLRQKFYKSNHSAVQLALYKLICSNEEREALMSQHIDHTTNGESIVVGRTELPIKEANKMLADMEKEYGLDDGK